MIQSSGIFGQNRHFRSQRCVLFKKIVVKEFTLDYLRAYVGTLRYQKKSGSSLSFTLTSNLIRLGYFFNNFFCWYGLIEPQIWTEERARYHILFSHQRMLSILITGAQVWSEVIGTKVVPPFYWGLSFFKNWHLGGLVPFKNGKGVFSV